MGYWICVKLYTGYPVTFGQITFYSAVHATASSLMISRG